MLQITNNIHKILRDMLVWCKNQQNMCMLYNFVGWKWSKNDWHTHVVQLFSDLIQTYRTGEYKWSLWSFLFPCWQHQFIWSASALTDRGDVSIVSVWSSQSLTSWVHSGDGDIAVTQPCSTWWENGKTETLQEPHNIWSQMLVTSKNGKNQSSNYYHYNSLRAAFIETKKQLT